MHISRLALDHYRSWDHCVLDFEPGINILQGSNGLGKTNIVEAVEVLSTGSSHRTSSSLPLVEKGHPSATVRANVEDSGEQRTYEITIAARGANRARVDGGKSQYMRDIVGLVPSVSFTPEDQRLVSGDPATEGTSLTRRLRCCCPVMRSRCNSSRTLPNSVPHCSNSCPTIPASTPNTGVRPC